ncbi:hypothetical protein WMY93_004674 [Mugilogobius chulae]|uniref:Ribosome-recycling factor, mitochondrial n=1 Tax=Mugilogobius chulae TaxID=88201 RepID=A0AAW0Q0I7_9GOBI
MYIHSTSRLWTGLAGVSGLPCYLSVLSQRSGADSGSRRFHTPLLVLHRLSMEHLNDCQLDHNSAQHNLQRFSQLHSYMRLGQATAAATRALRESSMNLNPEADGNLIKVPVPSESAPNFPLTVPLSDFHTRYTQVQQEPLRYKEGHESQAPVISLYTLRSALLTSTFAFPKRSRSLIGSGIGLDPNAECDDFRTLLEWLFVDIWSWLRSDKDLPKRFHDNVQCLRLLLRHGFRLQRCRPTQQTCLLLVTLQNFTRFFPLAELLLERGEEFTANQNTCVEENRGGHSAINLAIPRPSHCCCCYFSVLREALCRSVQHCSEAEVHALLDKANALLDLPIVDPAPLRFTVGKSLEREPGGSAVMLFIFTYVSRRLFLLFTQGAVREDQGAVWAVDAAPAPLQSLCCSYIRRRLLPWPLEPKIQTLPLPQLVKEMLMPLPLDQD